MMCTTYPGITATSVSAVPASCTPRCSRATLTTINACPTGDMGMCLFGALMADTTPSVAMATDMGGSIDLDCGTCFDLNRFHCFSLVCPAETSPFLVCDQDTDTDMCMGEQTALQTCLTGIVDGSAADMMLNTCFETQVTGCFDTSGGFAPTAAAARASRSLRTPSVGAARRIG